MAKASKCTPKKTIKQEMERETNWATSTRRGASLRNYDAPVPRNQYERERVQAAVGRDGRTEQHHAKSCDINTIMMKYQKTGVIDHINEYEPKYGDVSSADFQAAQNLVAEVKSEFHDLPAYVRAEIGDESTYLTLMQSDEGVSTLKTILHPGEKYTTDGSPDPEAHKPNPNIPEPQETSDSAETRS